MPQFKVTLDSVDKKNESENAVFTTYVEANTSEEAIEKAKVIQQKEKPELNRAFFWTAYKTAEKHD
jgi:hypothetical protein